MLRISHSIALLLILLLFCAVQSCKKDATADFSPDENGEQEPYEYLEISSQPPSDRIAKANNLLIWQSQGLKKEGFTDGALVDERGDEFTPDDDIFWLHVADVRPLEYEGQVLSATHVSVKDNIAYVSYHARGEKHLGAVESIDLTDRENPVVLSQVFFSIADVNAIEIDQAASPDQTKLWVALSDFKKGGVVGELSVENGVFSSHFNYASLSKGLPDEAITASANSIEHAGDYLYVTSGKSNGGVFMLDPKTLLPLSNVLFPNAKSVAANGTLEGVSKIVSLQTAGESLLRVETMGKCAFEAKHDLGAISHQNSEFAELGKSTVRFRKEGSDMVFVAMGAGGIKAFDLSGEIKEVWSSPAAMIRNGNCNSVATDDDFLYAANGADGLAVFQLIDGEEPNFVFSWDLSEENASVNFVETDGDWLFVAKGQGGLKILKRPQPGDLLPMSPFDKNGAPLEQEEKMEVCATLLPTLFDLALPEYQDQQTLHPEYFNPAFPQQILLEETCEVALTFINEQAGYTNTLGYYYYDADNPPASLDDLAKIIVFPNASAVGSGGELEPGSTMKLLGSFNKNTVIGFFLIANGWQGGTVTNGYGTIYTDPAFNPDGVQQSLIFYDQTCSSTVIAFEDIVTSWGGDKDFNDAIFQITTTPLSGIDVSKFIQIED